MKPLYESILTGSVSKPRAKVQPSSREELEQIIKDYIGALEPHPGQEVDFNWIDISLVKDLRELFANTDHIPVIDKWDITHVKDFSFMFTNNKCIKKSPIPVLQGKLLRDGCYKYMFSGCSFLEEPPVLPAKKLTMRCYYAMFEGCHSLKTAPELPAATVLLSSYSYMFCGCDDLDDLPKINKQAWSAANGVSWGNMFSGCWKIQKKYDLPKFMIKL